MLLMPGAIIALIGAHLYLVTRHRRHDGAALAEGREDRTSLSEEV